MNELKHLAIIMDGNGRWAKAHILERSAGHEAGARVVEDIAIFAAKRGIKTLSLYISNVIAITSRYIEILLTNSINFFPLIKSINNSKPQISVKT